MLLKSRRRRLLAATEEEDEDEESEEDTEGDADSYAGFCAAAEGARGTGVAVGVGLRGGFGTLAIGLIKDEKEDPDGVCIWGSD